MIRIRSLHALAALAFFAGSAEAQTSTQTPAQTRMLRSPSVSATQIAFAYAQNIWIVDRAGGAARRLTSFQGTTENPKLSPDGKWVAFSGEYGGNVDVYVVPAEGGEPKRLRDGRQTVRKSSSPQRAKRTVRRPRRNSILFRRPVAWKKRCRCRALFRGGSRPTANASRIA
jgi:dipeptidyl aminopeptidase/acylaminoacyl peptidase